MPTLGTWPCVQLFFGSPGCRPVSVPDSCFIPWHASQKLFPAYLHNVRQEKCIVFVTWTARQTGKPTQSWFACEDACFDPGHNVSIIVCQHHFYHWIGKKNTLNKTHKVKIIVCAIDRHLPFLPLHKRHRKICSIRCSWIVCEAAHVKYRGLLSVTIVDALDAL